MQRLLNQHQLAEFFGNTTPDDLFAWMKEELFDLPEPVEVCGQHLWWSDQIESAVMDHFRRTATADNVLTALIKSAIDRGDVGFREGWASSNAIKHAAAEQGLTVPKGPHLTYTMRRIGYKVSYRPHTSFREVRRFPNAAARTRLYHTGVPIFASDAEAILVYDASQN